MIVLDASAIVALLAREPECDRLIAALEQCGGAVTSPIAIYEAVLGLRRKRHSSVAEAEVDVMEFLGAAGVEVVPIDLAPRMTRSKLFRATAKGRSIPAQLNLGDCFAYAQAKSARAALLFKGGDFSKTDIEAAV